MTTIWAFLIYWLVVFVGCYVVVEIGQDQLYDEETPRAGLKVGGASLILALMLAGFYHAGRPASFESMSTTNILGTVLQAIVWFAVFTLILQFHPWHALGLGIATMILVSGLATMGVNSILSPTPASVSRPAAAAVSKPVRQSLAPPPAAAPPKAEENAK
jgi:drug/metabolite transporter (DMT)-like permease